MRKQFVACSYWYEAADQCPWACRVHRVPEGFWCFESEVDYLAFIREPQ